VAVEHAGDGTGRLFLISQGGRIFVFDGSQVLSTPFLDITSLVRPGRPSSCSIRACRSPPSARTPRATSTSATTPRTASFTDSTIVAGATPVRAVHVTELRSRIDALRASLALPAFAWTTPTLTAGSTPILAVHVSDMRTALNEAYAAAASPAPMYTDPALPPGTVIRAVHIVELREAVLALE
jgi:hypothetical protein